MKRHIMPLILLLIASFWSIRSLTINGYFPMHDDTQVGRVVAMGRALRNGQFPVRWVSDLGYGYGYPIFNFYGPLPYYLGGFIHMLGVPSLIATKIMIGVGIVLVGITMYVLVSSVVGPPAGVLAGVLAVYAPYHAVQVFVRGAVGELWALAFLPLIALGLVKKRAIPGGIGLAGVILSHTILGYITVLWYIAGALCYAGYLLVRKRLHVSFLMHNISLLAIGLSLSAFFWLPAIAEMKWTGVAGQVSSTANYLDHFVCLPQLWNSLWGFGGSVPGCIDGMSFKLGKLHIILALVGVVLGVLRQRTHMSLVVLGASTALAATALMLPESQLLWNIAPFSSYVQYPWRFLTFATLGLSLLGGLAANVTKQSAIKWTIAFVVGTIVVVTHAKLFVPQFISDRPVESYETDEELRFRVSKISDEYLPREIQRPGTANEIVTVAIPPRMGYQVETEVDTETYGRFVINSSTDTIISMRRAYFPGWTYVVNGVRTQPVVINGLPEVSIPSGSSVVEMHFYNTPVRSIGNMLSVFMVLILIIYGKKKTKIIA